jgi:hypothetical protein
VSLTQDQLCALLLLGKMVTNNHSFSPIAQQLLQRPLDQVSLSAIAEAIEAQRSATGAPDTFDALIAVPLEGTHMLDGLAVCSRCLKASNGTHHTAVNCRQKGQGGERPHDRRPSKERTGKERHEKSRPNGNFGKDRASNTKVIKGSKAFLAQVEASREEAVENGEVGFWVGDRCFKLAEGDSVNEHDCYTCLNHHPCPILDCGAQTTISNKGAGDTYPTTTRIRGVGGTLTGNMRTGRVELITGTNKGLVHRILFSNSLIHPSIGSTLISYHHLLKLGYKVHLGLEGGTVRTPQGGIIELDLLDGLWRFPPAPTRSQAARQPTHTDWRSANPWEALVASTDGDDRGKDSSEDVDSNAPDDESAAPADTHKAQELHNRLGHPGRERMLRI